MVSTIKEARSYLRFKPDPLDYAQIQLSHDGEDFQPDMVALIVEEAPMGGCALVMHEHPAIAIDRICTIKLGGLTPLGARVVWIKELESDLIHVGYQFIE
jgi:hypothetical protein